MTRVPSRACEFFEEAFTKDRPRNGYCTGIMAVSCLRGHDQSTQQVEHALHNPFVPLCEGSKARCVQNAQRRRRSLRVRIVFIARVVFVILKDPEQGGLDPFCIVAVGRLDRRFQVGKEGV